MQIQSVSEPYDFSPDVEITRLDCWNGHRFVIRDDLLPGGTKQRACAPYLSTLAKAGYDHFVYASPFSGFAQVALAFVAQKLGLACTIVCERDQRQTFSCFHPFSMLAHSFGAHVLMVESLEEAEEVAFDFAEKNSNATKLPLGFDSPIFRSHLKEALLQQFNVILSKTHAPIHTLWLPVGSGTLARTFHDILPASVEMKCVNVRVLPETDRRIRVLRDLPRVSVINAPMPFHESAEGLPDIPSNIFYDAKIWDFLKLDGNDGDLWWNVAR